MNVLIVGAGAIGCLLGGKLARAGRQVTLAGRPTFVEAVRSRGLLLADETGRHNVRNVRAVLGPLDALARAETAFDLVVFTVKSYDTAAAAADLLAALAATGAPAPALLSVQNGVGNEESLAAALPGAPVLAGSITTPVSVEGPGAIHVDKPRYGLGLGVWPPAGGGGAVGSSAAGGGAAIYAESCALFAQAGFAVKQYEDAEAMKWTKLLMNMMGNATCAILDEPPQTAFADSAIVDLEIGAWREALAVMAAAGIRALNMDSYPFALLAPLLRYAPKALIRPILRRQISGARGGKLPSLHIDLHGAKGRSEVGWLNGAVVHKAAEVGVATPINRALSEVLGSLVVRPAEMAAWRGNHGALLAAAKSLAQSG